MKKNLFHKSSVGISLPGRFKMSSIVRLGMYLLLLDIAFVFLYPFMYMVITSFKSPDDLTDISVNWLINEFYVENYKTAGSLLNYFPRLFNTTLASVLCTAGHVLSCSFIGYGFARYEFRGKGLLFFGVILSLVVPVQTIIVPLYILYSRLGMIPGQLPVIFPTYLGFGLKGALFIFIFRQFFLSLPKSLEEAARIDGCNPVRTFFRVALPATGSSVLVCSVLSMVWHWNDFFEPTLYIKRQAGFYLSLVLPSLYSLVQTAGEGTSASQANAAIYTVGMLMAATTMIIIPLLIIYCFVQKRFMAGIETSGITGE